MIVVQIDERGGEPGAAGVGELVVIEQFDEIREDRRSDLDGAIVGIDHFGASAPAKDLFKAYGFTAQHVIEAIERVLAK